jgi:hypothetical protein
MVKTDEDSGYNVIDRWISPKELEAAKTAQPAKETDDIPF